MCGCKMLIWGCGSLSSLLISDFFSAALPGAVSGDIVRAYHVARGRHQKAALATSVVFDRALGLYTLILAGTVAVFIGVAGELFTGEAGAWSNFYMQTMGLFVVALFGLLTVFGGLFMSSRVRRSALMERLLAKLPFHKTVTEIYDAVYSFGRKPALTLKAAALSAEAQISFYLGLWCFAVLLDIEELSGLDYIIALPVSLVINAIPIAPGGLGIGEAGFSAVFSIFGFSEGAELGMLFHTVFLVLAVGLGGLMYLFMDVLGENREKAKVQQSPKSGHQFKLE